MWNNINLLNRMTQYLLFVAGMGLVMGVCTKIAQLEIFSIKEIVITGDINRDTKQNLENVIRERVRGGFFTIDLDETKSIFESLTRVKMAHIRRKWPTTLQVEIIEHRPVALWNDIGFVSRQGNIVVASVEGLLANKLPAFRGPNHAAKDILSFYLRAKYLLYQVEQEIARITVDSRYAWEVTLQNDIVLRLGKERQEMRLARFVNFSKYALGDFPEKIHYLDMRYEDGFAIGVKG